MNSFSSRLTTENGWMSALLLTADTPDVLSPAEQADGMFAAYAQPATRWAGTLRPDIADRGA